MQVHGQNRAGRPIQRAFDVLRNGASSAIRCKHESLIANNAEPVTPLRCDQRRVVAVLSQQQIRRSPDVDVLDHRRSLGLVRQRRRASPQLALQPHYHEHRHRDADDGADYGPDKALMDRRRDRIEPMGAIRVVAAARESNKATYDRAGTDTDSPY
jgi:hypothetical protein